VATTNYRLLAVAACLGGGAAVAFLTLPDGVAPERTVAAPDPAPASAVAGTIATASSPPATPAARLAPSAMASLDDATLLQRAHDEFGLDCPEIEKRSSVMDTGFDVHCTDGTRLRVSTRGGVLAITTAD
jgi:hypothetical protein